MIDVILSQDPSGLNLISPHFGRNTLVAVGVRVAWSLIGNREGFAGIDGSSSLLSNLDADIAIVDSTLNAVGILLHQRDADNRRTADCGTALDGTPSLALTILTRHLRTKQRVLDGGLSRLTGLVVTDDILCQFVLVVQVVELHVSSIHNLMLASSCREVGLHNLAQVNRVIVVDRILRSELSSLSHGSHQV